jgi:hypothetical protein
MSKTPVACPTPTPAGKNTAAGTSGERQRQTGWRAGNSTPSVAGPMNLSPRGIVAACDRAQCCTWGLVPAAPARPGFSRCLRSRIFGAYPRKREQSLHKAAQRGRPGRHLYRQRIVLVARLARCRRTIDAVSESAVSPSRPSRGHHKVAGALPGFPNSMRSGARRPDHGRNWARWDMSKHRSFGCRQAV